MFYFLFRSKMSYLLSQVKSFLIFIFLCFNGYFFWFYTLIYLLNVFHNFGHHGRPASKNFNPLLSFDHFNHAIILINNNKKCVVGILRYGLGPKQPKLMFWALKFHIWALTYVQMSSYFTYIQRKKFTTTFSL